MTYKDTRLWLNARQHAEDANAYPQWQRLEACYDRFWDKATRIAGLISQELPGLTLHDEKHLEAVWKTADLIAGDDYPMTPLEVFVFGGAVLLHDLGHTVTAYEGGYEAIKQTDDWKEAVLSRLDLADDEPNPSDDTVANPGAEIEQAALFDTLRALHAEQAEKLCEMSYEGPFGEIFLLDDDQLRPHLGPIIGQIAASHHWDREDIRLHMEETLGPIGAVPDLGEFEPAKLACLLRCADACQIDQRRAPDVDYALHQPQGHSTLHWDAQNRLSLPRPDKKIENSIAFTSTLPFEEKDAETWWIAHDLIQIAHRELQECASLLRDLKLPTFAMKGVADATDALALTKKIKTSGWTPVDASIRVSDPRRMVQLFGGEQYYGKGALWVALRELLQNGIDAIEARRVLEPGFAGRILVEQEAGELEGKEGFWLHVSDDGIGMSERVLPRTLVDFGRSAKSSGELTREIKGLKGKRVPTIGKFGIGFFSVLMLSDHVKVHSRPLGGGDAATKKLQFAWGTQSRPLLMSPEPGKLTPSQSTRVSLFIGTEHLERLLTCVDGQNKSLCKLIQMIAPLPNCQVHVCDFDGAFRLARSPELYVEENASSWLISILDDRVPKDKIFRAAAYLTPVRRQSGIITGWATLDFSDDYNVGMGYRTERGICAQDAESSGGHKSKGIIGVLPCIDTGPRRDRASKPRGHNFDAWLAEQLRVLEPEKFSLRERDSMSVNIYSYGGDPVQFSTVMIQSTVPYRHQETWLSLDDFIYHFQGINTKKLSFDHFIDDEAKNLIESKWNSILNDPYFIISSETFREDILMDGLIFAAPNIIGNQKYRYKNMKNYVFPNLDDHCCLTGCLRRRCEQLGLSLIVNDVADEFIGLSRDDETGQVSELYAEHAVQVRIRS